MKDSGNPSYTQSEKQAYIRFETVSSIIFMFLMAAGTMIVGPLLQDIIREFNLNNTQASLTSGIQSVGAVAAIIAGGIGVRKIPKHLLIFAAGLLYAAGLLMIPLQSKFGLLLVAFAASGAGARLIDMIVNAYISDLHPEDRTASFGLIHCGYGIGALSSPILVWLLSRLSDNWKIHYILIGGVLLAVTIVWEILTRVKHKSIYRTLYPAPKEESAGKAWSKVLRSPALLALAMAIFLVQNHLFGIITWSSSYITEYMKGSAAAGAMVLSVFWLAATISRLTVARLGHRVPAWALLTFGCLAAGICCITGFTLKEAPIWVIYAAVFFDGLFAGHAFPVVTAAACDLFPDNSGEVTTILFFMTAFGITAAPLIMGRIADTSGLRPAMIFVSWLLPLISLFSFLYYLALKRQGGE